MGSRRAAGMAGLAAAERAVRLLLVRRLLAMRLLTVTPVVVLRIGLLLSVTGIAWAPPLIGHRAVPGLLRRWRIPRVIRHVARSLSSLNGRFRLKQ